MKSGKIVFDPASSNQDREDEKSYIALRFYKNTGHTGGNIRPENKASTRLQEISLLNNTYFGSIYYDIHLDTKLDFTISR